MSTPKKIPNTRLNTWFSEEDFLSEIEMGREAVEADNNFTVILYKVDRSNTNSHDLYGEANKDEIKFFPPIELKVLPIVSPPTNKTYNQTSGSLRHNEEGQLTFSIYEAQLSELDIDIDYGDYVGYPVSPTELRFFAVVDDGRVNYDNAHTIMGFQGAFRTVKCAIVDENEFRGV